ncbi:MAG TPA: ROK family protein [Sphingobium sp.]|nr:ROK family protein [Sphingobium sp.]
MTAARLAGVELGGTKALVLLAEGDTIIERHRIETHGPADTLGAANAHLQHWNRAAPIEAVGIASFGPIMLRQGDPLFGRILPTPKPGWAGADVHGTLMQGLDCPAAIDTDVNGAALAEYRWGAGQGVDCLWYITIGTGVGGGLLIDGRPFHGAMHSEIGHIRVKRQPRETFEGTCAFHGDCIEGLVSGPALAARFGTAIESVGDNHPRWRGVALDIAELVATLFLTTAAQRILLGGTVALERPFLLPRIRDAVVESLAGYLPFITQDTIAHRLCLAGLGNDAGPAGAIALAQAALGRPAMQ